MPVLISRIIPKRQYVGYTTSKLVEREKEARKKINPNNRVKETTEEIQKKWKKYKIRW